MPREATATAPRPAASAVTEGEKARATVLVVDDDPDIRGSIAEILEEGGYSVMTAANGRQALDYLVPNEPPACILVDLWMPVMDGWSLIREVRRGRLAHVPMIVITAAGLEFDYPVPRRYVLRKPFDLDRLLGLVAELVGGAVTEK
jgi:CheY-like chemotaxis protein